MLEPRCAMRTFAYLDARAADGDRLQWEMGEGPAHDAVRSDPVQTATNLAIGQRWPRWSPAALDLGIHRVLTVRLFITRTLGTLNLYAGRPGKIDSSIVWEAEAIAAHASVLLAAIITEGQLRQAVSTRGLIGQAQGVLMHQYGIDSTRAFAVLRRISQDHNIRIVTIAEQLTTTGTLPGLADSRGAPKPIPPNVPRIKGEQMTSATDIPVESGQGYTVADVEGHQPASLDDFAGDVHLTLVRNDQLLRVMGTCSAPTADAVRFYQKDLALHDRDIRVWTITQAGATTFLAAPYAAF